jgi:predicted DNA-binding transcriptional regulator AlpA
MRAVALNIKGQHSMAHHTDPSEIPDALTNYDLFPDSAHVRLPVVQALVGCSSATVWRMVKRGTLPAPRKLSERISAWNVGDLRKALAA